MVKSKEVRHAPGSRMLHYARLLQAEAQFQHKPGNPNVPVTPLSDTENPVGIIHPLSLPQMPGKVGTSLPLSPSSPGYVLRDEYATELMLAEPVATPFPSMRAMLLKNNARALLMAPRERADAHKKALLILAPGGSPFLRREDANRTTLSIPAIQIFRKRKTSLISSVGPAVVIKTAQGAAIAGISEVLSAILRFTLNIVLTHVIARGTYGLFVETFMLITVLGEVFKSGLDAAVLRFLPDYLAKGNRPLAVGLITFAGGGVILAGLAGSVLCFFWADFLADGLFQQAAYRSMVQALAPLVALITLQMFFASILQALGVIKQKVCVDRLLQPLVTLLLLGFFALLGMKLQALIFALLGGFLVSVVSGGIFVRRAMQRFPGKVVPIFAIKHWLVFIFPLAGNSVIRVVLNSLDIFCLGLFVVPAMVGLYGAADRLGWVVGMPLYGLNIIFAPMIATYYVAGRTNALGELFKLVTSWAFSLSLPLLICMILFGQTLLTLFGREYQSAYLILLVLALSNFVEAASGPVQYLLVMTGRPLLLLLNTMLAILINIGLETWLVPLWQGVGAACATLVTVLVLNLSSMLEVGYLLRKSPYRCDIWKPLLAGGVAVLAGLGIRYLSEHLPGQMILIQVLLGVLPLLLVYGMCLWWLGFSREDQLIIRRAVERTGFRC